MNCNGISCLKPRGIGSFITNNIHNRPLLQNKQQQQQQPPPSTVVSSYISSSPKQPAKPITRVN
jgi:hypothetical protein